MKLFIPKCISCEQTHFPPRAMCPRCGGATFDEKHIARGILLADTKLLRGAGKPLNDPVRLGLIDSEGVVFVAKLDEKLSCGTPVSLWRNVNGAIQAGTSEPPDI